MFARILGASIVLVGVFASPAAMSAQATTGETRSDHQAPVRDDARKDPVQLCERLAGTERELCLRQAQENRDAARDAGVGTTPGAGGAGEAPRTPAPAGAKP